MASSATASCPLRVAVPPSSRSFAAPAECTLVSAPAGGRNSETAVTAPPSVAIADDRVLMLEFQERGEVAAFEELFRRHRVPLYRFLRGLSCSAEIAEETSQHAWLKVIEAARAARYNATTQSSFKTWLYTLARNQYIDRYLRGHACSRTDSNSEELLMGAFEDANTLGARVDLERLAGTLGRGIGQLPIEQREVIMLWAQGHELTVIAQIVGAPWETVVSRKKYAIAKLRSALERAGVAQGDV
jgi:RNA polymerase sigma factor (sigma-70 family)